MTNKIRVGIYGAAGRMGQQLLNALRSHPHASLGAAFVETQHALEGKPVALEGMQQIFYTSDLRIEWSHCDVIIDFSTPTATQKLLQQAQAHPLPLVIGTTGLSDSMHQDIARLAQETPLVWAANFSMGIAVLQHLVKKACQSLPDFDVEMVEIHHRNKVDAPSGTALALSETIQKSNPKQWLIHNQRVGSAGPRSDNELGVFSLRGGDVVGEHMVCLFGMGERIELIHRATDRMLFAQGALHAAQWLGGRAAGLYTMADILGLEDDKA